MNKGIKIGILLKITLNNTDIKDRIIGIRKLLKSKYIASVMQKMFEKLSIRYNTYDF